MVVNPYGIAAGQTGEIRLKELAANGATYVALKAPDLLAVTIHGRSENIVKITLAQKKV